MAEWIQLRGVGHHAGPRVLFENVDLSVHAGTRLGLIGPNGAGKTTLLRILAGEETADAGDRVARRGLRIAWVQQSPGFDADVTVEQVLRARLERAPGPPPDLESDVAVRRTLGRCGFDRPDARLATLSGGWRRRVAIAAELAVGPDLLLLDEPTNHLDLEGIEWLEQLLVASRSACVVVSHDRRFLESVATHMAEIDPRHGGGFFQSAGNYSSFLLAREEHFARLQRREQSLAAQVREEVRYLRQGAKARTTKSIARVARAHEAIAELDRVRELNREREVAGAFRDSGRRTRRLVVCEELTVRRGTAECFTDLDLVLGPGRRVGLVGPNGSGKTTLLRTLLGEIEPERGRLQRAPDLRVVYFDQERERLDEAATLAETLSPEGDHLTVSGRRVHVTTWSRQLLFRDDQLAQPIRSLSGGERARVLIGRLMSRSADLLLLDEPTNDLDIPTLEMLERSLVSFEGAVVLVTHDRFLMDRVVNSVLALDGQGAWRELADLAQWQGMRADPPASSARVAKRSSPPDESPSPRAQRPGKLSYNEQREFGQMEARILEAEADLRARHADMARSEVIEVPARLREASHALQQAQLEVDRLYARWTELEARSLGEAP